MHPARDRSYSVQLWFGFALGAFAAGSGLLIFARDTGRGLAIGVVAFGVAGAVVAWLAGRRQAGAARQPAVMAQERMLAHPNHAVVSVDAEGRIQTFSGGAARLFGYAAAEVIGHMDLTGFVDQTEIARRADALGKERGQVVRSFAALVGRAASRDEHEEHEWTCVRRDGTHFSSRFSVTALASQGKIDGYLVLISDTTEAQAAVQQRREIDARLGKIASQVPGMLFQYKRTPDGRNFFPYASGGIRDIFGLEPAEVTQDARALWDRIHLDDRERVRDAVAQSAQTLQRLECRFRTYAKDGSLRWVLSNSLAEPQADGSIVWHGFVSDVTAATVAELAHEENRTLLQSILASVDLGVFLVDVLPGDDFRFVEVNPAYERLTGITAAEIRGRTPQELVPVIPAEMAACLRASFRRGIDAAAAIEYEEPFFVRGRLFWWQTRLTPLRDATGKVVRLVGRSLDITERKAVELRVQSLTERLQLATEAAQVGIWDYDLVQNKLVCDARMLALYGISAANFDSSYATWRERVHPDDRTRIEQEYREALDGKKPYNTSFRIVRPDGDEREIRARAHVQRNPAGRATRVVAVHWDVTAERRAQAEIEFARDQAEDLNRQLEDALERAHRLAQEAAAATVAKSEFLANMSHEIRTPLNAIIGMSGLLLGTDLNKDQREFGETIRSSGDGLLALVNDILDYSKIESGRLELEHRAFDLRQCIESSVDVLAGRAAEKKLDLVYAIDPSVPESIVGDTIRLRQVIVNLLSNAVKFTAKGEVFLSVGTVHAQDTGRVRLRLEVHDSGIGIPADRMDRLFKTFSQVDASTTRQFGGTGLGLAISKRIVELMGGRIWVESTAGQGSTFCFEVEAAPAPSPAKSFPNGRASLLTGRRLLVIDDNATAARVVCQQVVVWGMVPRAVASAAEALSVLQRGEKFDAVLVDFDLGAQTGAQALAEVRRHRLAATLPAGLMTVAGAPRPGADQGIAGTINKPVKTAALFELLGQLLQGRVETRAEATDSVATLAIDRPLSILLAEDNPVNQRVATLMLQRLGYRTDVVGNGRDAVNAALRQRYDLILMDVQMPEMDGLQASREICARLSSEQRPRIVAMTANASIGDRDRCLDAGMSDFLTKPVRTEDLRRALEETPIRDADPVAR